MSQNRLMILATAFPGVFWIFDGSLLCSTITMTQLQVYS